MIKSGILPTMFISSNAFASLNASITTGLPPIVIVAFFLFIASVISNSFLLFLNLNIKPPRGKCP